MAASALLFTVWLGGQVIATPQPTMDGCRAAVAALPAGVIAPTLPKRPLPPLPPGPNVEQLVADAVHALGPAPMPLQPTAAAASYEDLRALSRYWGDVARVERSVRRAAALAEFARIDAWVDGGDVGAANMPPRVEAYCIEVR